MNVNEELVINIKITKEQRGEQEAYGYETTTGENTKDVFDALVLWLSRENNDMYAHLIRAIVAGDLLSSQLSEMVKRATVKN